MTRTAHTSATHRQTQRLWRLPRSSFPASRALLIDEKPTGSVLFPKEGTPSSSEHAPVFEQHASTDHQGDNQERLKHEVQRVPKSYVKVQYDPVDAQIIFYVLQDMQLD